jgi:hypothetical protein
MPILGLWPMADKMPDAKACTVNLLALASMT